MEQPGSPRLPQLQLAIDGAWEKAIVLPLQAASLGAVLSWLTDAHAKGEGAAEIVYASGHRSALIGVRARGVNLDLFSTFLRMALERAGGLSWGQAIELVRQCFGPEAFAPDAVESLEIGVFNAWRLHAVQRLWTSDGTAPDARRLSQVASEGLWSECSTAPLLLEAAWSMPIEHWSGVTVSNIQDSQFVMDRGLVTEEVAFLMDLTTGQAPDHGAHTAGVDPATVVTPLRVATKSMHRA